MSEELELFEDLLRDWIKFGMSDHFTPEEMQEKVEGWKRIREKLESNKRPRGRPSKGETYTFMFNRHVIEFRLAERGETRKKAIQGVMARLMGWSTSKAREYERTHGLNNEEIIDLVRTVRSNDSCHLTDDRVDSLYDEWLCEMGTNT
jgi:hypothetical protein